MILKIFQKIIDLLLKIISNMKKHILVSTVNRETAVLVFDTLEQAKQQMIKEYNETIEDNGMDIDEDVCAIFDESAYANADDDLLCDWSIHTIEV